MERVPAEIWSRISSYACMDTGFTGRSLSLVSKFIRDASARVKLQSAAVHGPYQIVGLHNMLLITPPHLRRIRFMFLSDSESPVSYESNVSPAICPIITGKQISESLCFILQAIAEHVQILYFDYLNVPWKSIPQIGFPRLIELASYGFPYRKPKGSRAPSHVSCPNLRRWHLISYTGVWHGKDAFAHISIITPKITHLRFSDVPKSANFSSHFLAALSLSASESSQLSKKEKLPLTLESVLVKPAPYPKPGKCGTPGIVHGRFVRELGRLHQIDNRIVLLPPNRSDEGKQKCTVQEWEERLNGGEGCWRPNSQSRWDQRCARSV